MEKAIERLRASKRETVDVEQMRGHEQGREWAMQKASYPELRRLSKFPSGSLAEHPVGAAPDVIAEHMVGDAWRIEELNFWYGLTDDIDDIGDEYAVGFVQGAIEVWSAVKDKV